MSFFAFGEILWDCLPTGRHAGGAPFNVAAHLAQLGASVSLISAAGRDPLGDEIVQIARDKGVDTTWVARPPSGLPTGTVQVTLDAQSNATYEIVQPVAWDEIAVPDEALAAVAGTQALVLGTLAARSKFNLSQIERLLALPDPLKFLDVNLRAPFIDRHLTLLLASRVDIVKLNDAELGYLTEQATPPDESALAAACADLAAHTGAQRICVTRAEKGAAFWERGHLHTAAAPHVIVNDTIGAGDAFTAALMLGLTRARPLPEVLAFACRLGAYVASQPRANPPLPPNLIAAAK